MMLTTETIPKFKDASPVAGSMRTRPRVAQVADPSSHALLGASSGCVISLGRPLYEQYWKVTAPPSAGSPETRASTCAVRINSPTLFMKKVSSYEPGTPRARAVREEARIRGFAAPALAGCAFIVECAAVAIPYGAVPEPSRSLRRSSMEPLWVAVVAVVNPMALARKRLTSVPPGGLGPPTFSLGTYPDPSKLGNDTQCTTSPHNPELLAECCVALLTLAC
jgi:hypothetical protein